MRTQIKLSLGAVMLGALFGCAQTTQTTPSNAEFSASVYKIAEELRVNSDAAQEARAYCLGLSRSRADDEPKCVAIQNLVRDGVPGFAKNRKQTQPILAKNKKNGRKVKAAAESAALAKMVEKDKEASQVAQSDTNPALTVDYYIENKSQLKSKLESCQENNSDSACQMANAALVQLTLKGESIN